MIAFLHWYFLAFFVAGIAVLIVKVVPEGLRAEATESRPAGAWARIATLLLPLQWVVPPGLIFFRLGELAQDWFLLRTLGLALSVYAAVLLLWAPAVMGRHLVPYAAILRDHELVTSGPFRFVRHPIYSANLALFLGAALGTLNAALLVVWPVAALGFTLHAKFEERLLRDKFGASFERYVQTTPLLIPGVGGRR